MYYSAKFAIARMENFLTVLMGLVEDSPTLTLLAGKYSSSSPSLSGLLAHLRFRVLGPGSESPTGID